MENVGRWVRKFKKKVVHVPYYNLKSTVKTLRAQKGYTFFCILQFIKY